MYPAYSHIKVVTSQVSIEGKPRTQLVIGAKDDLDSLLSRIA